MLAQKVYSAYFLNSIQVSFHVSFLFRFTPCKQEISLERTYSWYVSVNSRLEAIEIIGQRKAFYRQRIPDYSCTKKNTFDIDILVTSWNVDRKTVQSIRITDRPLLRIRNWNQLSQPRWTSTKVIPIKRLKLAIFGEFRRGSKVLPNLPQDLAIAKAFV